MLPKRFALHLHITCRGLKLVNGDTAKLVKSFPPPTEVTSPAVVSRRLVCALGMLAKAGGLRNEKNGSADCHHKWDSSGNFNGLPIGHLPSGSTLPAACHGGGASARSVCSNRRGRSVQSGGGRSFPRPGSPAWHHEFCSGDAVGHSALAAAAAFLSCRRPRLIPRTPLILNSKKGDRRGPRPPATFFITGQI